MNYALQWTGVKSFGDITDPSLAKALTHPLRARILSALDDRTASPSQLAGELGAPLGVTSYHVRRLESLGFLKLVKRVPRRGAIEHYYRAKVRPPRLSRVPVTLDAEGWEVLARELDRLLERVPKIEAESRRRLSADGEAGRSASVVVMLLEDPNRA